jgi:hypothetical protein
MTLGPEAGQVERKRAVCAGGVHGAAVLVLDAGQARVEKRMTVSEDRHPVLYGAVGLDRQGIGSGGMGFVGTGRGARAVLLSESLRFAGPEGTTVTVTSGGGLPNPAPGRGRVGPGDGVGRRGRCSVRGERPR